MPKLAKYFISRIIKAKEVTWSEIIESLRSASIVNKGAFKYTVINFISVEDGKYYGELAKYEEMGESKTVDEVSRTTKKQFIPDKARAIAPFVILADEAAIAHQHVWNEIREDEFRYIFEYIVKSAVAISGIELIPITNDVKFYSQLSKFDGIFEIDARIVPPNPLFGPLWEELRGYLLRRKSREVRYKEKTEGKKFINTELLKVIINKEKNVTDLDFGDKALFMAMDGYGEATIKGKIGARTVVISTGDKQESLQFDKAPIPQELSLAFSDVYGEISRTRDWNH